MKNSVQNKYITNSKIFCKTNRIFHFKKTEKQDSYPLMIALDNLYILTKCTRFNLTKFQIDFLIITKQGDNI